MVKRYGPARPVAGALFDMDGLVLDTERLYVRFWMEAAHMLGFPMTFRQALNMRSLGRDDSQALLEGYFGPTISYDVLREKRIELMDAYIADHGVEAKPGIVELLDALNARGIPAAITSSSPPESIQRHLTALGLYHRFAKICSGRQVPHGKPAPDIYLFGAASLGLDPEQCLALEDSPTGILAAHRAGCMSVMVPDLDQPTQETVSLLYAQADTLADVIDLL